QCLPPTVSGITLSNTSVTINWTPALGAIQYNLRYRPAGTSTWVVVIIGNGISNSTTLQNLAPATAYEFQIRTKCNDNPEEFSPYSGVLTFTTLPLRLSEGDKQLNTLLYPNPTNSNINVVISATSETQTTIRITDLLGRVLLNETEELLSGNNTITYNIGEYAAGVYLVHVGNGNTQQVFKVVKE
ncbi:MAG: T9SS type A sorting domain-containing protein, partial [Bacteroidota bacterium]